MLLLHVYQLSNSQITLPTFVAQNEKSSRTIRSPVAQSTPARFYGADLTFRTPVEGAPDKPLEKLNAFLECRDISPVRHVMMSQWEDANERTRRRHVRKAKQAVTAVLDEVAPNQHHQLWHAIASKPLESLNSSEEEEDIDNVLMEALAQCYTNADRWDTKRQILSIMADKVTYCTLQRWIPTLSRYRFTVARKHTLVQGRGVLPKPQRRTRAVSQTKLDHFLDFILSPHMIQDLPFGEKTIKLSSKEVITVPNVVRLMIPEYIATQYQAYAEECGFTPLSRSTLLRILSVCSASTRKSLQGLDYISATGFYHILIFSFDFLS